MKRFAVLAVAAAAASISAGFALAGSAGAPTSVSLSVSPGGASCTFRENGRPKVTCANLKNERIKSGTRITLTAKANAPVPAGWKLFIYREYVGPDRNAFHAQGGDGPRTSFPGKPLCSTSSAPGCTKVLSRTVIATTFDLYRAVVQKADGTNFEAQMYIRWCDKSTPGCVS
jgi:hypothetical protein